MSEVLSLEPYFAELDQVPTFRWTGQVTEVVGLLVESRGPHVAIGDFCEVRTSSGKRIRMQVIGFRKGRVLSMPLEEVEGLQLGDAVEARPEEARVAVIRVEPIATPGIVTEHDVGADAPDPVRDLGPVP